MDVNQFDQHERAIEQAKRSLTSFDTVLIAHGILGNPQETQNDYQKAEEVIRTNFLSIVSLLTIISPYFESQKKGTIAVISSVAGDRGRKSNYIYGCSKAALNVYLQGLRGRLASANVSVITIKPGFVDTPMTAGFKRGPLFSSPRVIAKGIEQAIRMRKNVVYLPGYWRWIMVIIKVIPETVFKKLNL